MMPMPHIPDGKFKESDFILSCYLRDGLIKRVDGGFNWTKEEIKRDTKGYKKLGKLLGLG